MLYREQRRYAEAEPLFQRAIKIWERAHGPNHPDVANSLNNLAMLYRVEGRYTGVPSQQARPAPNDVVFCEPSASSMATSALFGQSIWMHRKSSSISMEDRLCTPRRRRCRFGFRGSGASGFSPDLRKTHQGTCCLAWSPCDEYPARTAGGFRRAQAGHVYQASNGRAMTGGPNCPTANL
jgi:Tetratricopeptide repeat